MRKVLLPVDGSTHAFEAALFLIDLNKSLNGQLEVHILNVEPHPIPWQTHGVEPETIQDHLAVRAQIAVGPVLQAFQEAGVTHLCHTKLGDTAQTIIASADEIGCDMIAMGTRGLGGLASLTLGSVTNKVLHQAKVPVICIKAKDE